jgi:hypothetical protein
LAELAIVYAIPVFGVLFHLVDLYHMWFIGQYSLHSLDLNGELQ